MSELFLIRFKADDAYVHFDLEKGEYWVDEGKRGAAIFTKNQAEEFISVTKGEDYMEKDWFLESVGVKTTDIEK